MSNDVAPATGGRTTKATKGIVHIAPGGATAGTALGEYSTPPKVAQLLHIRVDKVRTWIASGELVAFDLSEHTGGRPRYRIHRDDLRDFLQRRQVRPAPKTTRRARYGGKSYV